MGIKAFVLIEAKVGRTREVEKQLKGMVNGTIESVDVVTGPYDVIMAVNCTDPAQIGTLIGHEIPDKVSGILRTVTCFTVPG